MVTPSQSDKTDRGVLPTACDCLAADTDMRADNRCTETQANCDAHSGIVHLQTDAGEWQGVEPVAGPRSTRGDETGTLNVVGGPMR